MILNKKNFNAVVVVEGKDDTIRLKQFFPGIETIETNGSAVSEVVLSELKKLSKSREIIIFTDPDFNGERIRRIVTEAVPSAKQAFITRKEGEPEKRGNSLGVEHASKEALERALSDLHEVEERQSDLTERVGAILSVGYGNAKTFYKRLNTFGISLDELTHAVEEANSGK